MRPKGERAKHASQSPRDVPPAKRASQSPTNALVDLPVDRAPQRLADPGVESVLQFLTRSPASTLEYECHAVLGGVLLLAHDPATALLQLLAIGRRCLNNVFGRERLDVDAIGNPRVDQVNQDEAEQRCKHRNMRKVESTGKTDQGYEDNPASEARGA